MTLAALITRVEQGSGSDRQLDADICVESQWGGPSAVGAVNYDRTRNDCDIIYVSKDDCSFPFITPNLTSSLDAIGALFKARLEVAFVTVLDNGPEHDSECVVNVWIDELPCSFEARLPDIHRAFLSATLKAIAAKEG